MTIKELIHMIEVLLTERQNNGHTGKITYGIIMNQGGIRSCKKIEEKEIKKTHKKK